jgi:prepilin signal peptidase PulO-like enzyme (type II secretory pathway)
MIYLLLAVLGLVMGSFLHAVVWRIHAHKDFVKDRSRCDHCNHVLAWYDLVPVASWLSLGGKCRYCHKKITWHHPAIEVATAALFLLSYVAWPYAFDASFSVELFVLWLAILVFCVALSVYDLRWMLLPDVMTYPLMVIGLVFGVVRFAGIEQQGALQVATSLLLGVATLAGLYGALYAVSRGKWVGFGDVKLGVFMGLALGGPFSVVALMAANILGVLVIVPGLASGRLNRKSRLPFGPFLIAGFIIAALFGAAIIDWYMRVDFGLTRYFTTPL